VLIAGGVALVVIPDKDEGRVRVSLTPGGAVMAGKF
jgi:hypothetical protein